MHSAHEIIASVDELKSLPAVYHRVRDELESPHGSLTEIAKLLAYDGALTARLLHVVNSPLYGFSGQIDEVMRAVSTGATTRNRTPRGPYSRIRSTRAGWYLRLSGQVELVINTTSVP